MEKGLRMWVKAVLIIAGLMLFCFLAGRQRPEIDADKEARIKQYEEDASVEKIEMVLLAYGENLFMQDKKVLSSDGNYYTYETNEVEEALYCQITAYIRENVILDIVKEDKQTETVLSNLWVSEVEQDRILCFFEGNRFYLPVMVDKENREQIADISLKDGRIESCHFKKEKISGKLLGVNEKSLRLETGEWKLDEKVKVYRLHGTFEEMTLQELPIGYENTDYVIDDGKICACLLISEEGMETIRVLIKSGNYGDNYHESVTMTADCDYELHYGNETESFESGERITITDDSEYYKNTDRILLTASVNSGRVVLESIQRSRESCDYRGTLEIIRTGNGLAVINELLLEEYLYSVVPSEMPSSYPAESLKAQAVCARTYAYGNMKKAGLPELGAHVDDSTAFQVYGNIGERIETTEAVKATKGQILTYQDNPINAYYYSTSCGYGADLRAWNGTATETLPYLQAKPIILLNEGEGAESENKTGEGKFAVSIPENLQEENRFTEFIKQKQTDFPESGEAWFRWSYEVKELNEELIEKRISERYALQPGYILMENGGDYTSQQPNGVGKIKELKIVSRNTGGNAAELLIKGEKGTYLIQTEYNIRYVLNDGEASVVRMDGSEVASPTLLPSSFFIIETTESEDEVTGYTITGGGYGHGIGMSQNGAKNMALQKSTAEEILQFFYEGSKVEMIY